jgi:hypothetical protein
VATRETLELIQRAQRLAEESAHRTAEARADFDRALNRLRRLAGRPQLEDDGLAFEHKVSEALVRVRDAVVSLPPIESTACHRPDFVVRRRSRTVLVDVMGGRSFSPGRIRRRARELAAALPRYDASQGFIAVPDNVYRGVAEVQLDPHVEVSTLSRLASAVDRALGGSP